MCPFTNPNIKYGNIRKFRQPPAVRRNDVWPELSTVLKQNNILQNPEAVFHANPLQVTHVADLNW